LGFLGSWRFGFEEPAHKLWIVLDFLGFSRPIRDFSMGCAARSRVNTIARLIMTLAAPDRRRTVLAGDPGWIVHMASLTQVLIFRKELSSTPFPFGRLKPKAKRSQRHGRKSQ
jgi:hypothetical protein